MKVAIFGRGKTGSKVAELLPEGWGGKSFGKNNLPNLNELRAFDLAICFIPGPAFVELIPTLLEAKIPVVTGATGFTWPDQYRAAIQESAQPWIHGTNFSIGMNLLFLLSERLDQIGAALPNAKYSMLEKHHTKKLDAPSGSALSLQERFSGEMPIESVREGDIVGFHEIRLANAEEEITISHNAKDRRIFARGSVWAAERILSGKFKETGLHDFSDFMAKTLLRDGES